MRASATGGRAAGSGAGLVFRLHRRPASFLIGLCTRDAGTKRSQVDLKGGRLPSLMPHIINRYTPFVVILLASIVLSGCSQLFGDPREEANQAIADANKSIAEHNKQFEQARDTYADVKKKVESGDDPSKEKEQITKARNTLQEAKSNLQDARKSLNGVQDLDVDDTVKKYTSLLSEAMDTQISAEAKEIDFYEILEKDPALKEQREKALDLLSEVGDGYKKAEKSYADARELANKNPKILGPGSKSQESGSAKN